MVLVKDDYLPPLKWILDKVTKTFPGNNRIIRNTTVKTSREILKWSIKKLWPINWWLTTLIRLIFVTLYCLFYLLFSLYFFKLVIGTIVWDWYFMLFIRLKESFKRVGGDRRHVGHFRIEATLLRGLHTLLRRIGKRRKPMGQNGCC